MALHLLPGERIEAQLRPSPWSRLGDHARVASLLAWAVVLRALLASAWWQGHDPTAPWRFWEYLYGNPGAAYVLAILGAAATGAAASLGRVPWWAGTLGMGGAALIAVLVTAWTDASYTWLLPALIALAALLAMAAIEIDRAARRVVFTNIRLVVHGGFLRPERGHIRYEDVADIDTHQGLVGRALDLGDLHAVPAAHARDEPMATVRGVRPLSLARDLLAAMVQHATASAELKRAGDTEARLYRALQAFGHAPRGTPSGDASP